MSIFQKRYLLYFCWAFIVPAGIAYFAGWDTSLNFLFFLKAFAIAFLLTVAYYLWEKKRIP